MSDHETKTAATKVTVAWVLGWFGSVTLSDIALICTIVYTLLQCFFLLRDKWWSRRSQK